MAGYDKKQLGEYVGMLRFALIDINLFLDTHPDCQEAMELFEKYKMLLAQAIKEYTMRFGPLEAKNGVEKDQWKWIKGPWPWEGVC